MVNYCADRRERSDHLGVTPKVTHGLFARESVKYGREHHAELAVRFNTVRWGNAARR
jgi:hypothetical protein